MNMRTAWRIKNIGAIDIGSNALRLVICTIYADDPKNFKQVQYLRLPLRLGDEAFLLNRISPEKIEKLVNGIKAFRLVMDAYDVHSYRACATSAFRESQNQDDIVERIIRECDINIAVIDGDEEAEIIFRAHSAQFSFAEKILFVDVGGGSTEITLLEHGKKVLAKSLNIGTVRILDGRDDESEWIDMRNWLKQEIVGHEPQMVLGSGGNINKLLSLNDTTSGALCDRKELESVYHRLSSFSLRERVEILKLNPDRADVILPAAEIFLTVLRDANIKKIATVGVGLRHGLIYQIKDQIFNEALNF